MFEAKAIADLSAAEGRAVALKEYRLAMTSKAGSEGKLFGSIGTGDIAEALTRAGHPVARAEVRMPEGPIRTLGEHVLTLHLHTDVNVDVTVAVTGED